MYSSDNDFYQDCPATPYDDNSTAHPSLNEFAERYGQRVSFPLSAQAHLAHPHVHNPHTLLDILYLTQRDEYGLREFFA